MSPWLAPPGGGYSAKGPRREPGTPPKNPGSATPQARPREVHPAYARALDVTLDPHLRSLCRLLVDEGHMTPYARNLIIEVLDEHQVIPPRAPRTPQEMKEDNDDD